MAIVGQARLGFLVTRDKNDKSRSIVSPTKSNLSALADTRAYRKKSNDNGILYLDWEPEPVELDADEALGGGSNVGNAVKYIREHLVGTMSLEQFDGEAKGSGITAVDLAMAKQVVGVTVVTDVNGTRRICLK